MTNLDYIFSSNQTSTSNELLHFTDIYAYFCYLIFYVYLNGLSFNIGENDTNLFYDEVLCKNPSNN
jgi:hypothetical protein